MLGEFDHSIRSSKLDDPNKPSGPADLDEPEDPDRSGEANDLDESFVPKNLNWLCRLDDSNEPDMHDDQNRSYGPDDLEGPEEPSDSNGPCPTNRTDKVGPMTLKRRMSRTD